MLMSTPAVSGAGLLQADGVQKPADAASPQLLHMILSNCCEKRLPLLSLSQNGYGRV